MLSRTSNAVGAVEKSDVVTALGIELAELWAHSNEIDARLIKANKGKNAAEESQAEEDINNAWTAISAMTACISTMKATSLAGALVQLSLVSDTIDEMKANGPQPEFYLKDMNMLARMVASIIAVVRQHAGGLDPLRGIYTIKGPC